MKNYGSIYLRKDGYYYGRVSFNGIKKSFYGKDSNVIQNKMNDFVLELKYNNVDLKNSVLFSWYCNDFLLTYKYGFVKDSSFDRLESIWKNHIVGSPIDIPVYKLNDVCIQRYLNSKILDYSSSTIKKIYDLIRSVLFYAYRKKDISVDYASLLVLPKSMKSVKQIEVYTDKEVDFLLSEIKKILSSSDKRALSLFRYSVSYILILNTGLRAGEMLALEWKNVDLVNNVIHVRQSLMHIRNREDFGNKYIDVIGSLKTQSSIRDIPLNALARECLLYLKYESDCVFVIDNKKGNFLKLRSYQQTFKRICEYIGLQYKGLHALRHTFASRLIELGVSPKVVSDLLGHTSIVFTMNRYVHTYDSSLHHAVDMLEVSGKVSIEVSGNKKQCLQNIANTEFLNEQPIGESNPCFRRERAAS